MNFKLEISYFKVLAGRYLHGVLPGSYPDWAMWQKYGWQKNNETKHANLILATTE